MSSHPQLKSGVRLILYPYLADHLNYLDSVPVSRKQLLQFTQDIETQNPKIKFDYSYMDQFQIKNLWFLELL